MKVSGTCLLRARWGRACWWSGWWRWSPCRRGTARRGRARSAPPSWRSAAGGRAGMPRQPGRGWGCTCWWWCGGRGSAAHSRWRVCCRAAPPPAPGCTPPPAPPPPSCRGPAPSPPPPAGPCSCPPADTRWSWCRWSSARGWSSAPCSRPPWPRLVPAAAAGAGGCSGIHFL